MAVQPPSNDGIDPKERSRVAIANADRYFAPDEEDEPDAEPSKRLPARPFRLIVKCALWTAWLGLIVGSVDGIYLAAELKVPIASASFFGLGVLSVVCFAGLGGLLGLLVGAVLFVPLRRVRPSTYAAIHFSTVGFLLFGSFFWTYAFELWAVGRGAAALVLSGFPLLLWPVLWMNAVPRMRRAEAGKSNGWPWAVVAASISLVVLLGATLSYTSRGSGGGAALKTDPNVVLISVEGFRADFERFEGAAGLKSLLEESVLFETVLAPHPRPLAAHASLLSGVHPSHHQVLRDADTVKSTLETLPRVMKREGFATAAFVSSPALMASRGLSLGFHTYDDSLGWSWLGFGQLLVAKLPIWPRGVQRRSDAEVVGRFTDWLSGHKGPSFLAWLHLSGAAGAKARTEVEYSQWLAELASLVDQSVEALSVEDQWRNTLFVVVGVSGMALSEPYGQRGLGEAVVVTPMLVRFPEGAHGGARVSEQVRSYDLYPTILARLELKAQTDHEGTALEGYLQGEMTGSMWCPLIGQNAGGTGPLLGIRHQQLKYMVDIDSGQEWLYDLSKDPKETTSVLESQPKLLTQLQAVLRADRAQLEAIQGSFFEAVD